MTQTQTTNEGDIAMTQDSFTHSRLIDAKHPTGDTVIANGRNATILHFNYHTDLWAVRYDDEPGVYYYVADENIS